MNTPERRICLEDFEKKQREAMEAMKDIITIMKEAAEKKKQFKMPTTEDDLHKGFEQESCAFDLCDGSGYTKETHNGKTVSVRCKCYTEHVLKRKLENSNIPPNFWDVELEDLKNIDDKINLSHLKPKAKQGEKKIDKRKKTPDPESPEDYVARTYDTKEISKGMFYFADNYVKTILPLLDEKPRKKTLNLMLMGDPGKGKTYMANAIAKEFLRNGKSVYFNRMRAILDEAYENKGKIMHLVRTKDLLIIDELGQEYHTDTKYALKQIQDIFKERQETGLPIIVTTNSYPNELEDYYEGSLMSTFHGRFLMMMTHGEYDLRTLEARKIYDGLDFLND